MIYLDNAATTFPKPRCVIDALYECVSEYCGNPGRSSHSLSRRAGEAVYEARENVSSLFRLDCAERVVFTYNATYALNLALKVIITGPCHVITSDIEHNAVIRPLARLERTLGIKYSQFDSNGDIRKSIEGLIRPSTRGIVSTLCSNVTGKAIPLKILSDIARERGLFLIIDASQAAGHIDIDLSNVYFDAFCAPAHKGLFGIQGCGFVIFGNDKAYDSFIEGGSGSDSMNSFMPSCLPERYEAGTLSTPAIVTLSCGIKYINQIGIEEISYKVAELTDKLIDRLDDISDIKLYSASNGIISFNISDMPSELICERLDEFGICTRSGLHCAPSAHKKLGTLNQGTVRVSLSCFNTSNDIDALYKALKKII